MKKVQSIEGSVSIEAALIIPIIIGVFIFFMTMMQVVYMHGKVQVALNEVCKDLTYDSYVFSELGITQVNQALYSKGLEQSVTINDLTQFKDDLKNIIPQVAPKLNDLHFSSSNGNLSVTDMDSMISEKTELVDTIVHLHGIITEISQSIGTESGYFINTMVLRVYINEKLKAYLDDIDVNYKLAHASGFLEDQSGQIVLNTEYSIPILFMRKKIFLKNGGYFHSFVGAGKYSESYNQVIKTSEYGKENQKESEDEDQDGFAKTVYITESGTKYHKNKQCFHIKVNVKSVRLNQLHKKRPCDYCGANMDEQRDSSVVYTTKNSYVFHLDRQCHSIYHHLKSLSEKEAISKGYSGCKTCSDK